MTTAELLGELVALGVTLRAEGGELRVSAPRGALTPALRERLAAAKDELLALVADRDPDPIERWRPARADEPRPLSFAQRRIWFLEQLEPGLIAYNMWVALTLRGRLDERAFERALREVLRRHEVLRSCFPAEDGVPGQRVHPPERIALERLVPPAGAAEADWRARVHAELTRRAALPFDLARGPLFEPLLARVAPDEHVFFARVHHLVYDGLSHGVLARELDLLYGAFARGEPSPLPEPPLQYHDWAAWQARRLEGARLERELAWWRRTLAGPLPVLELPFDRPRPRAQTHAGANHVRRLPDALAARVEPFARARGTTVFAVLLAAYQALLARVTRQHDVLVGTAAANRGRAELEGLIGSFVNTLVVRTDASGDPSFEELLRRAAASFLGAWEHQELPFERLVDALAPERDLAAAPLVQTLFVLNQDTGAARALGDLALEPCALAIPMARADLVLTVYRGRDGTFLDLEYKTDLFDAATVQRLGGWYETLLEDALAHPGRALSALALLPAGEAALVLERWNRTGAPIPAGPVHAAFEACADAAPDAPALLAPGEQAGEDRAWSYRELEERANRIAGHLRARGVRAGALVGLCLEREPDLVAALLAILKCGAAYVPLDPGFPAERLAFLVADSGPRCVVTREALRALLPAGTETVSLDAEAAAIAACPAARPAPVPAAARMYVLYTSGSTGRPKGVELSHRGVASFLASMRREPGFAAGETLLALTTLAFDISVLELFLPLTSGGRVALAPRAVASDGERLRRVLARLRPEVLQATPATWRMLLDAGWQGDRRLRALCGGEALTRELADLLLARCGALWNLYGPTETTVWSAAARVAPDGPVAIGRPIANTRAYVLDPALEPALPGATGELWLAGAGVARGYLGRPRLTAERFLPDPFGPEPGARMYRTGDLARWRPRAEGTAELECLGRTDQQVKLRGFRIELGEVEAALAALPGVRAAAVVRREDRPGDPRLVGFFAPEPGAEPAPDALADALARALPAYMVPARLVRLDALPLTPGGKVDRKALAARPLEAAAPTGARAAPRDALEERLCALLADVLGVEAVGVQDSFFALGGNSLSSTRAMARVREACGVELPLRALFEDPTAAGLARRVRAARPQPPAPIPRADRSRPPRLSFAQERLWFLDQLEPGLTAYNLWPAATLRGPLDAGALERALAEVVRRHEVLRTRFEPAEDGPVQVVLPRGAPLAHDLEPDPELPLAERRARLHARLSARALEPYDLATGPLFRPVLARLAEDEHVLALFAHHSVLDGGSIGVVWRELAALYPACAAGEPSPLAEPGLQYADVAAWQRAALAGEGAERLLAYWREALAGELSVLELPLDRPRPAVQTHAGATVTRRLPPALVRALVALAREERATLFMGLLAAYDALLARVTGQRDLCVGTAVAGRGRAELEELVGFFAGTLVVRVDASGDPTFRELLRRARASALGAFEHQDMPFERLVDELSPERSLAVTPLFQTLLVLDQDTREARRMGPLALAPFELAGRVAHTDLALWAYDGRDGFDLTLEYNTDLFDAATVERLLAAFERLLASAVRDPERRLSRLELLAPEERRRALEAWNPAPCAAPLAPLHALFERAADAHPDAPALVVASDEDQDEPRAPASGRTNGHAGLTYAALDARANRIAWHLRARGVSPGALVGLCCEREPDLVAALLAILKCGAAYVPLDPGLPPARLATMARDAGLGLAVAQEPLRALLPAELETVLLDLEADAIARRPAERPALALGLDERAYVLYTSGSTGTPKGVELSHRGVASFLASMRREPGFAAGETLLALTTLAFDISVLELFLPLTSGGRVALAPRAVASDGERLRRVLARLRPEVLQATPATWRMLLDAGWQGDRRLRALCGGEALTRELADLLLARCGALWNLYGPTETTVWSAAARVAPDGPVAIGRPIANTRAYVLDPALEPALPGATGELWLAGAGVARGYLGRPRLTAERFLPDPFGPEPGARMYRTGDLARWRPRAEGTAELECLGRTDQQVKLRGFRIELGEVEAALAALPGVRAAAVVRREDRPGDPRLVGFFAPEPGAEPAPDALADALARALPAYMVPARLVRLDALPLTAAGKVDRKALPAPAPAAAAVEPVAPRDAVEARIAGLWSEILGVEEVGVHDSFFELGGSSLSSTRAMAAVRRAFEVELPLRLLFEDPTVAGLAARVRGDDGRAARARYEQTFDRSLIPLQPRGEALPLFLVSGAHADEDAFLRFVGALLPHMGREQPIWGFKARGLDGRSRPHASAEEMAADYVRELRERFPHGPYLLTGNCVGGIVAFEMARQLAAAGAEVGLVALLDTVRPQAGYRDWLDRHYRFWKKERFVGHLRALGALGARERAGYVWTRARRKLRQALPLTEAQRRRNGIETVERDYSRILARYEPAPYAGRLDVILNEGLEREWHAAGWEGFAREVVAHVVPGDHVTRLSQHAATVARILRAAIERAPAAAAARSARRQRDAADLVAP